MESKAEAEVKQTKLIWRKKVQTKITWMKADHKIPQYQKDQNLRVKEKRQK